MLREGRFKQWLLNAPQHLVMFTMYDIMGSITEKPGPNFIELLSKKKKKYLPE